MTIATRSTGIFPYEEMGNLTKADRKYLRERALSFRDLEGRLENLKTWAFDVLRQNAAKFRILDHGIEFIPKPGCQEFEVRDANMVLNHIGALRDAMREGKLEQAVLAGLDLGRVSVQLFVRPHEKPAITGRKVMRKTAENRDSEGLRLAKQQKAAEHKKWARCAQQYRTRHPNHSAWDIARHVANELKTSQKPDTIRRALRKITGKV